MTRENISLGTTSWDGTGDTLKSAGQKINNDLVKIWLKLGGDSDVLMNAISFTNTTKVYEGASADSYETSIGVIDPTADRNINFPNASGTVLLDSSSQTLVNKILTSPVLTTPQINDASLDHQYVFVAGELVADRNVNLPVLSDSDTFAFTDVTQTLLNKTLTAPNISSPNVSTAINDTNGAELFKLTATGSAVNEITLANAATGNNPVMTASGADSDIGINLINKGTGAIRSRKTAYEPDTITGNGAISLNYTYHICNKGTALALTLADGTVAGENKIFTNKGAGAATVTPSNFAQGSYFVMSQYESCEIVWDGSNWYVIGNQSVLTIG